MAEFTEAAEEACEWRVQRLKQHHARVCVHLAQQSIPRLCNTKANVTPEQ